MATWTDIPSTSMDPGKPVRSIDALALRDNPIAISEGATGAPRIQSEALANYVTKTAAYTALSNDFIFADTTGGAFNITLPLAPANFQRVTISDYKSSFASNNLTVIRNGKTIMGLAENMTIDINNALVELMYINNDWRLI